MTPLPRLGRRGPRPASPPARLGGADVVPGALTTLEREPDAFAADRFTVEVDERDEVPGPTAAAAGATRSGRDRTSSWRLLGRLGLVVGLSLLAFHHAVGSLFRGIAGGSVVVYVLAVPLYAGLAAAANNRRPGYAEAGAVRRRDLVAGSLTCLVALGFTSLLGPGLSGVHELWRLDLLMLWVFLLGATVLSFGVHQVTRSWPFWVVSLLLWPFPVRLANTAAGGATGGALLLLVVVLGVVAYGHRPHDPPRWQVLGSVAATGGLVLALSGLTTHPQRLLWPSVAAAVVAALWWAGQAHVRPQASVVEHRIRGTGLALVGLALLGLVVLPAAPRPVAASNPTGITALSLGPVLVPGFARTASVVRTDQQRYFGRTSVWQRVSLRESDPRTGAVPGGREIVVDVVSTPRPQVLDLYPVVTTYPTGTLSSRPDAVVDLGHGVTGQLFRAEDPQRGLRYTLLTFSWRLPVDMALLGGYTGPAAQLTQRVTLLAVDDHRAGATFPEPGNATLDGFRTAVEQVGRARQPRSGADLVADEQLLDDAARALVHQRLTGG